ncbi:MAG: TPM domain-containing protein [Oscillospiraceae bacterium]|nr:TPM domain-containing protein [Oscillospiraceae bacterium]
MVYNRRKALLPVCVLLTAIIVVFSLCFNAKASGIKTKAVVLSDLDNCLSEAEEKALLEEMREVAEKTGLNIGIVITAELDGKKSKKYADDFSDDNFGLDSNSIVLLLFNSHDLPQYSKEVDQISTSGNAIDLFEKRINSIFDRIYDELENKNVRSDLPSTPNVYKHYSSANYYIGCMKFCAAVERYGDPAMAFWNGVVDFLISHLFAMFIGGIIGLVAALVFSSSIKKSYTKKSPISAAQYLDKNRTNITRREDIFIREYTTSYTTSSSSGGHGGGGRSGGGGGHHGGGGGRHR